MTQRVIEKRQQVIPEVLYPGNMQQLQACFVYGQLPKRAQGTPGELQFGRAIGNKSGHYCDVVTHYRFDPIQLGEFWNIKPHVWLLLGAQLRKAKWYFFMQAQPSMVTANCNAEWPVLISSGTHLLWAPRAQTSPLIQVRSNGTVVPLLEE